MDGYFLPNFMSSLNHGPLHKNWLENPVVPILVPQQMLSEWFLSLIPPNGRNDLSRQDRGRKSDQPVKCGNCGSFHKDAQMCPAANRKCYNCRRYGHYASLCRSKDNLRERCEISSVDEISDCESEDSFLSVDSVSPSQRVAELELKLQESQDDLKVKIKYSEENPVEPYNDVLMLRDSASDLQVENRELTGNIKHLESLLNESKQKADLLEKQQEQLCKFAVTVVKNLTDLGHLSARLLDEHNEVSTFELPLYGGIPCIRCDFEHPVSGTCPADDWYCCICSGRGHFAAACEKLELPEIDVTDEIHQLIECLEQTFGVTFEMDHNCEYCLDSEEEEDQSDNDHFGVQS